MTAKIFRWNTAKSSDGKGTWEHLVTQEISDEQLEKFNQELHKRPVLDWYMIECNNSILYTSHRFFFEQMVLTKH